jgi:hypothetical protein
MAAMAVVVVTSRPSLPLNFAAVMYFGPVLGTRYSVAGATAGALAGFLMARRLRVDPSTLGRWEKGEREPKAEHLRRMSRAIWIGPC